MRRRDPVDFDALRAHRLVGEFDRVLGDVDGVVADALQVRCDFEHRGDLSQLAGDGLLAPDQLDAVGFDAAPQIVDRVVAGYHAGAGRGIPIVECFDRDADGVSYERTEPDDVQPSPLQCLVIRGSHFARSSYKSCSPQYRAKVGSSQRDEATCALYQKINFHQD